MKKITIIAGIMVAVMLGLCGTGHAGSLKGIIQCTSGASAEGVVVYLPGDSFSSITDEQGGFILRDMPAGTHSLKVKVGEKIVTTISEVKVRMSKGTDLGTIMVNCEGS